MDYQASDQEMMAYWQLEDELGGRRGEGELPHEILAEVARTVQPNELRSALEALLEETCMWEAAKTEYRRIFDEALGTAS